MIGWVDANGAALRYAQDGSGAETILIIHEGGGCIENWQKVADIMSQRYSVIRYDQRGFGQSERASTLSQEQMIEDAAALLDALGIEKAHIVGTAVGGGIALGLAARHRDKVLSVSVTTPQDSDDLPDYAPAFMKQRAEDLRKSGLRPLVDKVADNAFPPDYRTDATSFAQFWLRYLCNDPEALAALTLEYLNFPLGHFVDDIACPTCVIGCLDDHVRKHEDLERFADLLANGRFETMKSCHFPHLATPDALATTLSIFLETIDA